VRLNPEAFHGDGCDLRLGHVLITGGSNVAQRFQRTTAPDGSVLLEADLDVTTTSPARGCDVAINVTAADAYGNGGHGSGALRIYEHGPVVTLSPQSYFGASPAQLSITVAAPFGDVSLDAIRIQAFGGYGCSSLRVNGQPVPFVAQPPFFWPTADVTRLLSRVEGPGIGARTWSGLVSAGASAGGCSVSFGPSDPVFGFLYDTAYFWITP